MKVLGIFILMERQFHRNESSWNVRSRGTKVPQERKFQGANVPRERKFHGSESSLCGLFAPRNESAKEQKGLNSFLVPAETTLRYVTYSTHPRPLTCRCIIGILWLWFQQLPKRFVMLSQCPLCQRIVSRNCDLSKKFLMFYETCAFMLSDNVL